MKKPTINERRELAKFIVALLKRNEARFRADYRRDLPMLRRKSMLKYPPTVFTI